MKHVVLYMFNITKFAKCKQFQLVNVIDVDVGGRWTLLVTLLTIRESLCVTIYFAQLRHHQENTDLQVYMSVSSWWCLNSEFFCET